MEESITIFNDAYLKEPYYNKAIKKCETDGFLINKYNVFMKCTKSGGLFMEAKLKNQTISAVAYNETQYNRLYFDINKVAYKEYEKRTTNSDTISDLYKFLNNFYLETIKSKLEDNYILKNMKTVKERKLTTLEYLPNKQIKPSEKGICAFVRIDANSIKKCETQKELKELFDVKLKNLIQLCEKHTLKILCKHISSQIDGANKKSIIKTLESISPYELCGGLVQHYFNDWHFEVDAEIDDNINITSYIIRLKRDMVYTITPHLKQLIITNMEK